MNEKKFCKYLMDINENEDPKGAEQKRFYQLNSSSERQCFLDFYSNGIGVILSCATFSYIPALSIVKNLQKKAYRRFALKHNRLEQILQKL